MGSESNKWWENRCKRFINPYNFVPFEGECVRNAGEDGEDVFTGYFCCNIEVLTPLFIPNTSWKKALHSRGELEDESLEQFYSYDFYSYQDLTREHHCYAPVIPGSEIRGAVRSVYEAAFNGCASSVWEERPLGRRTPKPKKPGILKKNGNHWIIIPCERVRLNVTQASGRTAGSVEREVYDQWKEGKKLYVKYRGRPGAYYIERFREEEQKEAGWEAGYLHKGEPFGQKKHYESIFIEKAFSSAISVTDEDEKQLQLLMDEYRDTGKNRVENAENWYKEFDVNSDVRLIYYMQTEDHVYMSPACIGKEMFRKQIGELLKQNGGYQPCWDSQSLCSACSVFGMVSGKTQSAMGSKVRFSDALLKTPFKEALSDCYRNPVILPELGEPKPGTVEFYTCSPYNKGEMKTWKDSYGYWTYDYKYINEPGKSVRAERAVGVNKPALRGRKFYWHSDVWKKCLNQNLAPNKMRQRIRPLKEEPGRPMFEFKVYFDHLTLAQLQKLQWSLNFNDPKCACKIGRAKPLGFGSVRFQIEKVVIRRINSETGKWTEDVKTPEEFPGSYQGVMTNSMKVLKQMVNWEEKPKYEVAYPIGQRGTGKNSEASHQWFAGNREISYECKNMQPVFKKILPTPEEELNNECRENWLYKLEKKS